MNDINVAIQKLSNGEVIALPTETVYGLGADCTNDIAVQKIFTLKGRPAFNPLIIHVANLEVAQKYGVFNEQARQLAKTFWPGPLTLVLPINPNATVSSFVTAGLSTIAIRCPSHPTAQKLLESYPFPIAAPSANKSGYVSPTKWEHVYEEFGEAIFILQGNPANIGLESAIIDCSTTEITVLRPGSITKTEIETLLNVKVDEKKSTDVIKAPGQLKHHYAPTLPVRLNVTQVFCNEALLNYHQNPLRSPVITLNLSPSGDLQEAATNLFDYLRQLDKAGKLYNLSGIAVAPVPNEGVGRAINERLERAAAKNIAYPPL